MGIFTELLIFQVSVILYIFAAFISIIFIKQHKMSNIVSNIICMAASASGAASSLMYLVSGKEKIVFTPFRSAIPYINFDMTIDRLSAFFILVLSILVFCVSLYSIGYISHYYGKRNVGVFNFLYSIFILSMVFVITAGNCLFFFIAWEAMSLVSYFLVIFESEKEENQQAGTLYIIMTHIGTAFILISFMIMFSYTKSFDMSGSSAAIPAFAKNIMFVFFLIGFGTKAGVVPVHIWLPYAHPAAPSNVSALMSGFMIKTAIYGILRFILVYLGIEKTWWGVTILCIGIVSAVLGVAYALMEHNIKRLLAFHSVENIGIIMIGLGVGFIAFALNNGFVGGLAIAASLLHTLNHTLFKGGLFLGAGSIQYSTHTKDIEKLGGLIKKMPVTALMILCFSLSISAIVPFNGFVSEWLTYQSLFLMIGPGHAGINVLSIISIAALGLAGALAVACFVKLFGISFLGKPRSTHAAEAKEVPVVMNIGMGILASLCLVIGLFPLLFLRIIDRVVLGMTGNSVIDSIRGGYSVIGHPVNVSGNSISPIEILAVSAVMIVAVLLAVRLICGKYIERKYGTWDCGFEALNSRMQYSATGFSKPIRIVLKILYRPGREIEIEEGASPYFPKSITYKVTTESIFERYLYNPVILYARKLSGRVKFLVQTGSIHAYLIYIFIAVLALMLYYRFS